MSEKDIAKELRLPYTTVRAYLRLSPERVAKLRAKQLEQVRQQTSERAAQAEKAARLAKAEAKAKAETEAKFVPLMSKQQSSIRIGMALTHDNYGEDYGVEEGQFKELKVYMANCPPSPGQYGEAGWWEWTPELKQHATSSQQDDGYPCYYPVERNTLVTVMYLNESIDKGMLSQDVDWTTDGGVIRWKIASA